jgi:hypothetical protein
MTISNEKLLVLRNMIDSSVMHLEIHRCILRCKEPWHHLACELKPLGEFLVSHGTTA